MLGVQQVLEEHQPVIEELKVSRCRPDIAKRDLFHDARSLLDIRLPYLPAKGEVCSCAERRVNVDQIHLAGELVEQAAEDVLVVAPDQLVAPAFGPPVGQFAAVAQARLAAGGAGDLVDPLDRLEGQRDALNLGRLARPNQLDLFVART